MTNTTTNSANSSCVSLLLFPSEPAAYRRTLSKESMTGRSFFVAADIDGKVNLQHDFSSAPSTGCHHHLPFLVDLQYVLIRKMHPY